MTIYEFVNTVKCDNVTTITFVEPDFTEYEASVLDVLLYGDRHFLNRQILYFVGDGKDRFTVNIKK